MSNHVYARGQHVSFTDPRFLGNAWSGAFVITELLPSDEGEPRYKIQSTGETYHRVAFERQLSARFRIIRPA
jgi:hypothetical protein